MPSELERPLALAIETAREAGAMIRAEVHRPGGPRGHRAHADVDEEAERLIRSRLLTAFPDWGYRGEETGSQGVDPPPRFLWLVDPNDGTSSFLKGHRGSSVSIALLRDRQPVLGVVYAPTAPDDDGDLIAWADGCGPATRNGRPIGRVARPATLGPHDVILVAQDADSAPEINARCMEPARYRPMTSIAYRLALAAAGDAIAGLSIHGAGDWDYAAGQALLRSTGADLFDQNAQAAIYSPQGESRGRACYGAPRNIVHTLVDRPWKDIYRYRSAPDPLWDNLPAARLVHGHHVADPGLLRRAQGCLLGQFSGDSLGSLVELQSAASIASQYPNGLTELADGGTWGTIAGQPTDDSELALALARSIIGARGYLDGAAAYAYGQWLRSQPFDVGATTRQALKAIPSEAADSAPEAWAEAARTARAAASGTSQGNGSLMRVSPLAIWGCGLDPDVLADLARQDSRLTHPNPVCQEACASFVVAAAHAVSSGATARAVYRYTLDWAARSSKSADVLGALTAARSKPPDDFSRDEGWVLIALQNAFYQLCHGRSAEQGIVDTVRRGGDTDTNAAIAGALLGAVHGRESLPARWRNLILSCRPLASNHRVAHPRPRPFWPVDALELAEVLLLIGSP
jgi:ADP-ribosylglycohydrolase/fructose-1,6-bisphosphatase/inositol monophosphatase family enzyme